MAKKKANFKKYKDEKAKQRKKATVAATITDKPEENTLGLGLLI